MSFNHEGSVARELSRRAQLTPEQNEWEEQMSKLRDYEYGTTKLLKRWLKQLCLFLPAFIGLYLAGATLWQRNLAQWYWVSLFIGAATFLVLSGFRIWKIFLVYRGLKKVQGIIKKMEKFKYDHGWQNIVTSYRIRLH